MLDNRSGERPAFWEEGAAEALQGERTKYSSSTPSANVHANKDDVSYSTAGHFSRWLIETQGLELFKSLLAAKGSGREMFESTYGLSFADAEAQYLDEAPHSYGAFISCTDLELPQIDDLAWSETINVDCTEPSVHGSPLGLYAYRVLTIVERGNYEVSSSGQIQRCRDGEYDVEPTIDEPELYGDIPPYTAWYPTGYFKALPAGAPQVLDLVPGRYLISAGFEGFEADEVTIDVTRVP